MDEGSDQKEHRQTPDSFDPDSFDVDLRRLDFPSDALSVKRFRHLFPENFDCPDNISNGFCNNDFFYPADTESPDHLVRLTHLICDERVVAAAAYDTCFPDFMNDEDHEVLRNSKKRLEKLYQEFKLADSPETARLLISQVEEEAAAQARADRQKHR